MAVSSSDDAISSVRRRAPAVPVVLAFVLGIVVDANVSTVGWWGWTFTLTALLLAVLMRLLCCSRAWIVCLLAAVAGMGAVRHHDVWFVSQSNNIGLFAREEPLPARLIGIIIERPQLIRESDEHSSTSVGFTRANRVDHRLPATS